MLIFLVGFMGSGKTTIGLKLAEALDIDFFDMDELIQDQQGQSIPDIFKEQGQDYFRNLEREMIQGFDESLTGDAIVATGGGAPCFYDNMLSLNQQGTTVYLELTHEALYNRLKKEADFRPLLAGKDQNEMLETIGELLEYRSRFYKKSTYIVDGNRKPQAIIDHILYLINE